jgi:hypothetical protein
VKGLSEAERAFLARCGNACDGSCRGQAGPTIGETSIAASLTTRGIIISAVCQGGGPWFHPMITTVGRIAVEADLASRTRTVERA